MRGRPFFAAEKTSDDAAEIEPILGFVAARLAQALKHDAREFQSLRCEQISGLFLLTLEPRDLDRPQEQSLRFLVEVLSRRGELSALLSKHHDNAIGRRSLAGKGQCGLIVHSLTP